MPSLIRDALKSWADGVPIDVDDAAWARLDALVELWARYGRAMNLLGDLSLEARIAHVAEGLAAVAVAERLGWRDGAWVDVGSGAGIPGLVVAAARAREVVLVEPREKRAAFLESAVALSKIPVCRVVRARLEGSTWREIGVGGEILPVRGSIRILSSKAVMDPVSWLETAVLAAPRGIIVCHVGTAGGNRGLREPDAVVDLGARQVIGFLPTGTGAD